MVGSSEAVTTNKIDSYKWSAVCHLYCLHNSVSEF